MLENTKVRPRFPLSLFSFGALGALALGACAGDAPPALGLAYDEAAQRILVTFDRELEASETLHARLRRGSIGGLDCASDATGIERIDAARVPAAERPTWTGPEAGPQLFLGLYDTAWLEEEPTPEMIAEAQLGDWVVDVCLMGKDGKVVRGQSFDIRRALDQSGGDGKFDGESEERIASTSAYAEACVAQLGEIPFFPKLADGDYGTYDCLESTPIPTTVTSSDGNVVFPDREVSQCDEPQYIYSLCEPNAVTGRTNGPRVAQRTNDQGTHWVLLCRKAKAEEGQYNDIAMIGHNPYTGKTCYFQNALYSKTDGNHVPHPGDKTESERSPQQSASLWQGIHGGLGSGIECAKCHSADPFIHTPWIDKAVDENGDPIVPKMGVDDDFVLGYNDAPYSLVNRAGQGWTMPRQVTGPAVAACTRCHRVAVDDRWSNDWNRRLTGNDSSWVDKTTLAYRSFEHTFWMPPDVDGLDATTWADSDYAKAMAAIERCGNDPSQCDVRPLPTDPIADEGSLPDVELEGAELAKESLKVLGAAVSDPSCPGGDCSNRRCAECHSVGKNGLRRWRELTRDALDECNLAANPADLSPEAAKRAVDCLRVDPADGESVFEAAKLGILTTGVQYTAFRRLFQQAYGDMGWLLPYAKFKARVGMPKGSHPKLSQREVATIIKWFKAGLPALDEVLVEAPAPTMCSEFLDKNAVDTHVSTMSFEGWGAQNAEGGVRMYGCAPGATDAKTCLTSHPDRSATWGAAGAGTVRELTKLTFRTSFWTRSSADGRFVGNGGGPAGSTITDLQAGKDIGVDASYDPGFFPDNSGFIFQGATGGAGLCAQSVLTSGDDLIDFTENGCGTASGINLYQHVARGVNGGDYFVINSQFTSDSGHASQDPSAYFNAESTMKFTPMLFTGSKYEPMRAVIVDSPYEGDSVLSPSGQLVASRLSSSEGKSLGYVIRRVKANRFGDGYTIDIDQKVATVCVSGAKPSFSFDERFIVTHHYHDGRADLILVDLKSGLRQTITNMPEGSYAMFPHFRSDGWIYFLVSAGEEQFIAASDAALRF